eukprot:4570972-Amphidinium_carterae.2
MSPYCAELLVVDNRLTICTTQFRAVSCLRSSKPDRTAHPTCRYGLWQTFRTSHSLNCITGMGMNRDYWVWLIPAATAVATAAAMEHWKSTAPKGRASGTRVTL